MNAASAADVTARWSAFLEACETKGPVVITRNGKADHHSRGRTGEESNSISLRSVRWDLSIVLVGPLPGASRT